MSTSLRERPVVVAPFRTAARPSLLPAQPRRRGAVGLGPSYLVVGLLAIVGYLWFFIKEQANTDYSVLGVLWVLPTLIVLSTPLLLFVVRRQRDPFLRRLIVIAFFAKLVAAFANYWVLFNVYGGQADAVDYAFFGQKLYLDWRHGIFNLRGIKGIGGDSSLTFARVATGVVYYVVGPSRLAGFVIFSTMGFWGLYLFLRAFQTAFPNGAHRRYAVLVLLFPSLVFWSSGIGKEGWMVMVLGLFSLGTARVFTHRRGGFLLLALGLAGTALVRPHISLMLLLAVTVGYFIRRSARRTPFSSLGKVFGLVVFGLLAVLAIYKFKSQFGVTGLNASSVNSTLNKASTDSATGEATFTASITPFSIAALLFRPFPWEATSLASLISAAEGLTLLVAAVISRRRLLTALRFAFRNAYVAFCGAYIAAFCVAFSTISNFGTLARERTQVLPFVFVLLSLPLAEKRERLPRGAGRYRPSRGVSPPRATLET